MTWLQNYSGVYVGTHGRNGDVMIMTDKGVIKGGSVKRKAAEERWKVRLRQTPGDALEDEAAE